jgi:hypothetical protein
LRHGVVAATAAASPPLHGAMHLRRIDGPLKSTEVIDLPAFRTLGRPDFAVRHAPNKFAREHTHGCAAN